MGNAGSVIDDTLKDIGDGFQEIGKTIEEGSGAVGRSVGDFFYPDNPKRRIRVDQLKDDIETMVNEFNKMKRDINEMLGGIQGQLKELLSQNGFESADDMDSRMQQVLTPETLAHWNEFKKTLNRDIMVENVIFTASGLLTIATGVVAYGLAICGAITVASAGAALLALGEITLALAIVVGIIAAIDADRERDILRESIGKLVYARINAKQSLEQLRVYQRFLTDFKNFLTQDMLRSHPEWFREFAGDRYQTALNELTKGKIMKELSDLDEDREAWNCEDPGETRFYSSAAGFSTSAIVSSYVQLAQSKAPADVMPVIQFAHQTAGATGGSKPLKLRLAGCESALTCCAVDTRAGCKWRVQANLDQKPTKNVNFKDITFTMVNMDKGEYYHNCQLLLLGHSSPIFT